MEETEEQEVIFIEIQIDPERINNQDELQKRLYSKLKKLGWKKSFYFHYLHRKSLDARKKVPVFRLRYKVFRDLKDIPCSEVFAWNYTDVSSAEEVFIVGAGPAGYFAALELIRNGIKPIILERGKNVRDRRRDLRQIQQFDTVNPDSNYCFGEGGAGTYSDGKLYTRSQKRGRIESILSGLVAHGASNEILYEAHPHIGSNKLPGIIANIRDTILQAGGEILFGERVVEMIRDDSGIKALKTNKGNEFSAKRVILATGHSARDVYYMLDQISVKLEFKPFALGVRIEHPQGFIDKSQLNMEKRHPNIMAASYKLVCQVDDHGVYSFCMCPGGLIVPAATREGEIVVNGMSLSKRDSPFANSGMVVEVKEEDLTDIKCDHEWEKGIKFQQSVEQKLFEYGDGSQKGPAQLVRDFIDGKESRNEDLPKCSYIPGIYSAPLHLLLPQFISSRLREALLKFNRKMPGYISKQALLVAVESRTSSPVRIPRDRNYESFDVKGLYPCGEGAGYAGGIISAALDGQNVAKSIASEMI